MFQCRPAMASEATREREEERKSEAREESESPREESEAREERARRRCGREPRARQERQRVTLRANELGAMETENEARELRFYTPDSNGLI